MSGTDKELEKLQAEYERVRERAEAAKAKAKAKLDRYKSRKTAAVRKHDAKRKIVAGGFLFKLAADGDENALSVLRQLQRHVDGETARPSDKKAFDGWDWPKSKTPPTKSADPFSLTPEQQADWERLNAAEHLTRDEQMRKKMIAQRIRHAARWK